MPHHYKENSRLAEGRPAWHVICITLIHTDRKVPGHSMAGRTDVKITEPIFIRKTVKRGYEITGRLDARTISRYGRSEDEAKKRFFDACAAPITVVTRGRARNAALVIGAR